MAVDQAFNGVSIDGRMIWRHAALSGSHQFVVQNGQIEATVVSYQDGRINHLLNSLGKGDKGRLPYEILVLKPVDSDHFWRHRNTWADQTVKAGDRLKILIEFEKAELDNAITLRLEPCGFEVKS